MSGPFSYIPGKSIKTNYPLMRYLPPLSQGVASEWLHESIPVGGIILDPFGTSPNILIEIAKAGYIVIVAANNPVSRFLIEMAAQPPQKTQLKSVLAEVAGATKGNERIEPFIRSLYTTECPQCGRTIEVDSFLWEKDAAAPYGKIINCQYCGESGERPASQTDIEKAVRYTSSTLHYARALERIAPPRHPDRAHAEEAITVYLPRALYAIFTLINKIESLDLPADRRKLINALLLNTFDQSNNLWGYPTSRERPKSLATPNRFREKNIWITLENSIDLWVKDQSNIDIDYSSWPTETLKPKTIYLFDGKLRDLVDDLRNQRINAVMTALPRPNQAFWSLSVLWAGWLWGRDVLGQFISAIRRRRYDWNWHTTALYAAFKNLSKIMEDNTAVYGIIGETEIGFISSTLIAANNAGFRLTGFASRFEIGQAQIKWKYTSQKPLYFDNKELKNMALTSGLKYLQNRGEPANFLRMHTASINGLYHDRIIKHPSGLNQEDFRADSEANGKLSTSPSQDYSNIQTMIRSILNNPMNFQRFTISESTESGYWGLIDHTSYHHPQSDNLEKLIVELLVKKEKCTLQEIDIISCNKFPGLYTPSSELIHLCLESYAFKSSEKDEEWCLREEDIPLKRKKDLEHVTKQIQDLGNKLGYLAVLNTDSHNREAIIWEKENKEAFTFFPIASAIIGEMILDSNITSNNPIIVLPGGRANLVAYKLQKDPRLAEKTNINLNIHGQWRFLKFRHLRWLSDNPLLSRENFDEQLSLDPLTYTTPQLRLL